MFERKYSSGRVVAKLAWIKVLVGEIRIGPGVGQRFVSPSSKSQSAFLAEGNFGYIGGSSGIVLCFKIFCVEKCHDLKRQMATE